MKSVIGLMCVCFVIGCGSTGNVPDPIPTDDSGSPTPVPTYPPHYSQLHLQPPVIVDDGGTMDDGGCQPATGIGCDAGSICVPPVSACVRSRGYYTTHPDKWACDSLNLGMQGTTDLVFDENTLLGVLQSSPKGNAVIILEAQEITALLNGGQSDPSILGPLLAAENWMMTYADPPGYVATSTPQGQMAVHLALQLEEFNMGKMGIAACGCSASSCD